MRWKQYFAAALMLVLATSAAFAVEQRCFELYPNNNASGPEGAILLNKCTGQSWLLVSMNAGSGNTIGWQPIPIDMSSDDSLDPQKSEDRPKTDTDAAYAD
jgi:hypothetical protein